MTDDELTEAEQTALAKLPPIVPFPASDRFAASMEAYWARHAKPAKPRPVKKPPAPGKMRRPKH